MKEDSKIIDNFKRKIKYIKKLNKSYYEFDRPIISDVEYDNIKKEILDFENKGIGFNIGVRIDHKNVESNEVNYENSYTSFSSSAGFFIEKNDPEQL